MIATGRNYRDIAEMLISAGADINLRNKVTQVMSEQYHDEHGFSALMTAARRKNRDIAEMLISAGADINLRDEVMMMS